MPSVSAIIPTYNRADNVCRAVESILAQGWPDLELIVVDDGSTDNTRQALRAYEGRIRYVHQENGGPGRARNNGVKHASGEWLAFLDSDDVWLPGKLERQMRFTQASGAEICFHDVSRGAPGQNDHVPHWTRSAKMRDLLGRELMSGTLDDAFALVMRAGHAFLTTTLLMKRSVFLSVGGMREWLLTNQDIDLYFQLFPRFKVAFLAESLAAYSPGTARAFEVASQKAGHRSQRGASRVHLDRSRAAFAALCDRLHAQDATGARDCTIALRASLKNLAGCHRRSGSRWNAVLAYLTAAVVSRSTPERAARRLVGWPGSAVLAWPSDAPVMTTFLQVRATPVPSRTSAFSTSA